jgi:ribonuclease HI
MNTIKIYTDGAASGNPGPGGFGTLMIFNDKRKEFSGGFRNTTNNRMELLAVIVGLEALKTDAYKVEIYSDSKYVIDAIEKGWVFGWQKKQFKGKKNQDLWRRYLPLHQKYQPKYFWVKGHSGHPENERCDFLAVQAYKQPLSSLAVDEYYEQQGKDDDVNLFN